jgi:hypothetical protein
MAAATCGTRSRYVAGCRCEPCVIANRTYSRNHDRHHRRVRWGIETHTNPLVDATEARNHLLWLQSRGIGLRRLHNVTGIARSTLNEIRSGRRNRITRPTANRIIAVGLHRFTRKPAP